MSMREADAYGMDGVVWLRPEYQGREEELVTLAGGADLVGVTRSAVSNWQTRSQTFPRLVMVTGSPRKRTKWVVADELVAYARTRADQRARPGSSGPQAKPRPRAHIVAERIAHHEQQVAKLAERERRQRTALSQTRAKKKAAERKLAEAREELAAEIQAVTDAVATTRTPAGDEASEQDGVPAGP